MNIGGNLKHMWELSLTDAVPVHDDPVGLVAPGALVEHGQVLLHLKQNQLKVFNWHGKCMLTIADRS